MRDVERVRASTLYRIVGEAAGGALRRGGFVAADRGTWVRSTKAPIREVIWVEPPRWAASLGWSLSLDFVPLVSYRNNYVVKWKADGRVSHDLVYNALTYYWEEREAWTIPVTDGRETAIAAADAVVSRVMLESAQLFDAVSSTADLPAAFEAKRSRRPSRHMEWMAGLHEQELLAYSLTLAKLGRRDAGLAWLSQFKTTGVPMHRATRQALDVIFEQTLAQAG